ncbi:MAG: DUF5675 family protein [Bacteroidota bacterium]
MHLLLNRYYSSAYDTIGRLYIDDRFACYTLEDEYQPVKVAEETRIPAGCYTLGLWESPKFSAKYGHAMIWVKDVPGFTNILIHCGNTKDDTAGCILVGDSAHIHPGSPNFLADSRKAYARIYPVIAEAIRDGRVELTIKNAV